MYNLTINGLSFCCRLGAELVFEDRNLTAMVSENLERMTKQTQVVCAWINVFARVGNLCFFLIVFFTIYSNFYFYLFMDLYELAVPFVSLEWGREAKCIYIEIWYYSPCMIQRVYTDVYPVTKRNWLYQLLPAFSKKNWPLFPSQYRYK